MTEWVRLGDCTTVVCSCFFVYLIVFSVLFLLPPPPPPPPPPPQSSVRTLSNEKMALVIVTPFSHASFSCYVQYVVCSSEVKILAALKLGETAGPRTMSERSSLSHLAVHSCMHFSGIPPSEGGAFL